MIALIRYWREGVMGLLLIALGISIVALKIEQRHSGKLQAQVTHLTALRKLDRANFETAAAQAEAANKAQVARIKADQQKITSEVSHDYQADLARLRSELAVRLRGSSPTDPGRAQSPGTGNPGTTAGGPDGEARVCISTRDYVLGAEHELQLDRLIEIWRANPFATVLSVEHAADHLLPEGGTSHLFQTTAVTTYQVLP